MNTALIEKIEQIYRRIDERLKANPETAGQCRACGKCCDFTAYDHRLYVTGPEMEYLAYKIGVENVKPMHNGLCPYNQNNKCTVHEYRFAGCRIFCCQGNSDLQSELTESILNELKELCTKFDIPYYYRELSQALNNFE